MILEFITNFLRSTAGLLACVTLLVFTEMFIAKKWYLSFTKNVSSAKVRRSLNLLLGVITSFALASIEIFAICDWVQIPFNWLFPFVVAFAVTLIYLICEKIFSEAEINELGKALCSLISKSDKFEGDISKSNIVKISREFLDKIKKVDEVIKNESVKKEDTVVDEVVARLTSIVSDGTVTDAEKSEMEKLLASSGVNLDDNDVFQKYKSLIG